MKYDEITAIRDKNGNILSADGANLKDHPDDIKWYLDNGCSIFCFCRKCNRMHDIKEKCECGADMRGGAV